ncbi:MAG TPA: CRISPR system precrRNA processing endoribonuclease RAMP protein Cas6 [Phototrophicaceae bacterium]|nr:CRISPR system precrRNA processing endoribonuclease RAMP protein Cas6 [Phototrophicaceae bacterium]
MIDPSVLTPAHILMHGMSVQHVRFTVRATERISFDDQPGSALRGALYHALADHFCSEAFARVTADHAERCPVCWLMALEDPANDRGRDVTRPLTIQPPEKTFYRQGESMRFGVSLIGQARMLLPYLARAVEWMGQQGIGQGRGRFELIAIHEYTPLLDAERLLMDGKAVQSPTLAVTPVRVTELAAELPDNRITLHFLTPTRLISAGKLVKTPNPAVMVGRLLERCQNLAEHYAESDGNESSDHWKQTAAALVEQARELRLAYSEIAWIEVFSGSKRQGRATPISGFTGAARWEGAVTPLREWLLWGQSLHVGKDAVKGNGWYRVVM